MPLSGRIVELNQEVLDDPSAPGAGDLAGQRSCLTTWRRSWPTCGPRRIDGPGQKPGAMVESPLTPSPLPQRGEREGYVEIPCLFPLPHGGGENVVLVEMGVRGVALTPRNTPSPLEGESGWGAGVDSCGVRGVTLTPRGWAFWWVSGSHPRHHWPGLGRCQGCVPDTTVKASVIARSEATKQSLCPTARADAWRLLRCARNDGCDGCQLKALMEKARALPGASQ